MTAACDLIGLEPADDTLAGVAERTRRLEANWPAFSRDLNRRVDEKLVQVTADYRMEIGSATAEQVHQVELRLLGVVNALVNEVAGVKSSIDTLTALVAGGTRSVGAGRQVPVRSPGVAWWRFWG